MKINQIILKKKSTMKTESTLGKQQGRETRRVLDLEGIKNNNQYDSQHDFNLQIKIIFSLLNKCIDISTENVYFRINSTCENNRRNEN